MDIQSIKYRLVDISIFAFTSLSDNPLNGLDGIGTGEVKVVLENLNSILFYETGRFNNTLNKSVKCSNIYQWDFDLNKNRISLSHLRFGLNNPVFLFDLVFNSANKMISEKPHLCKQDEYHAEVFIEKDIIKLNWLVKSNIKYNKMEYEYR